MVFIIIRAQVTRLCQLWLHSCNETDLLILNNDNGALPVVKPLLTPHCVADVLDELTDNFRNVLGETETRL